MTRKIYSTLFVFIVISQMGMAQCFEPDASIWLDTWASCEESPNPKTEYGNTHWIQYDFGSVRTLSKSWVWNANDPNKLEQGFNLVKIDYSTDGETWEYWGEMNFPKAEGAAVYGGFPGPDLLGIEAQYVLLTAMSNHGDPSCAGFAEIKFNLMQGDTLGLPPGGGGGDCVGVEEIYIEEVSDFEAFIFWEHELEDAFYVFEYRIPGGDWIEIETEEPEVFLEDLTPDTEYEFRIGIECGDDLIYSDTQYFTTLAEGDCAAVSDIWLEEFDETTALVVWEEAGEGDFYLIAYTVVGSTEIVEDESEYPEIYLEDLEPGTEYEIVIGIECGDDVVWSEPFIFSTDSGIVNSSNEVENKLFFKLYPNPTPGQMNFQYSSQESDQVEYAITDIMGKKIKGGNITAHSGTHTFTLDLSQLPEGVYLFNAFSKKTQKMVSERIVKL